LYLPSVSYWVRLFLYRSWIKWICLSLCNLPVCCRTCSFRTSLMWSIVAHGRLRVLLMQELNTYK
jgi:hypothetical protein